MSAGLLLLLLLTLAIAWTVGQIAATPTDEETPDDNPHS